jgi:tetratricopeptide (TPR) repeat protein
MGKRADRDNAKFRQAREATPSKQAPGYSMSRTELASAVNAYLIKRTKGAHHGLLDSRSIGRYERGEVRWPSSLYRDAFRAILNVESDFDLGFAPPIRHDNATRIVITQNPSQSRDVAARSSKKWTTSPSAFSSRHQAAFDRISIDYFEHMRTSIIDSDNLFGPSQVIPAITGQIELLHRLRQETREADQRSVCVMQTKYAELAGWLYHDHGDFGSAEYWTDRALEWSHAARDQELTAFILARRAQLAGDEGDALRTLDMGAAARSMVPPNSRLAAVAATHTAHGYALRGDFDGAERAYDEARQILEAMPADPDSACGGWLDESYVEMARYRSLALLGRYSRAVEGFESAIERVSDHYPRDRGVYLARAARAYAGADNPEHAAELGSRALTIGLETKSGRILAELKQLDNALAIQSDPRVVEFKQTITEVTRSPIE